jgi:hypothetical protein
MDNKNNEMGYIYNWIDESIREVGFSTTLEKIKNKQKVGQYLITKPIRNIMMSYFKVLLDTPLEPLPENRIQNIRR